MDRLKGSVILLVILYVAIAFVCAGLNPFHWHWVARLAYVGIFATILIYFEQKFGNK